MSQGCCNNEHTDDNSEQPDVKKTAFPLSVTSPAPLDEDQLDAAIKSTTGINRSKTVRFMGSSASPKLLFDGPQTCGHDHDEIDPNEFNKGFLNRIFKSSADSGDTVNGARSAILALGAYALASQNIADSGNILPMLATAGLASLIANDATEELMESVQRARVKLGIGAGAIATALSAAHITTEGIVAVKSHFEHAVNEMGVEFAMQLTNANNLLHGPALGGVIALTGSLAIAKPHIRKASLAAMTAATIPYAAHIAIGEAGYPYGSSYAMGAVGAGVVGLYGLWKYKAKVGCPQHGDACTHFSTEEADETDYFSKDYIKEARARTKEQLKAVAAKPNAALKRLNERVKSTGKAIANLKIPTRQQTWHTMKSMAIPTIAGTGLVIAGHEMTDNMVSIAEVSGAPAPALGIISGIGLLAPEGFAGIKSGLKARAEQLNEHVRENYTQIADAMVIGCSIFGTGAVGATHAILANGLGNPIPDSFSLDVASYGWSGVKQMAVLTLPIPAYWAATRPKWAEKLAHFENRQADKIDVAAAKYFNDENLMVKAKGVSNWLRQSKDRLAKGEFQMSKTAAFGLVSGALLTLSAITVPIFHSHGDSGHWVVFDDADPEELMQIPRIGPD